MLAPDEQQRRQLAPLDRELEPLEDLLDRPDPSADAQQLEWERRTKQDLDRK